MIPRDFQLDPVKDLPVHVDFMRLGEGAKIRVRIPVQVLNADQAPGVKRGGTVNIVTHAVEVLCAPEDIPEAIDVDISGLEINYSKHLSDIALPPSLRVVERIDPTLVTIVPPSGYAEEMKAAGGSGCCGCRCCCGGRQRLRAPAEGGAAPARLRRRLVRLLRRRRPAAPKK